MTIRALAVAAAVAATAALCPAATQASSSTPASPDSPTATITVGGPASGVPATSKSLGFLGMSTAPEWISGLSGTASDPDPAFTQLLKNLSPGASPLLRIGGTSADDSWWPIKGMKEKYLFQLTPRWAKNVKKLLTSLGGKALMGVNLKSLSEPIARAEVKAFKRYIGSKNIYAYELGNEPEDWPRTTTSGNKIRVRNHYLRAIAGYAKLFHQVNSALGGVPVAGPGTGSKHWFGDMGTALREMHTHVKLVTVHDYGLMNCTHFNKMPPSKFFTAAAIEGVAQRIKPALKAAKAAGDPLRVDEMNGLTCGGQAGLSNSFAEALWALNVLPALWQAGVQGVNFQTVNASSYGGGNYNQMISTKHSGSRWRVSVQPVYYGLLAFAQTVPAGSRLLKTSSSGLADFYQYAVRAPNGSERVVLTNVGSSSRTVGVSGSGMNATGSVSLLSAASLSASGGTTLAGQSLSPTTGKLAGASDRTSVPPNASGLYTVTVPAHSAAILTLSS